MVEIDLEKSRVAKERADLQKEKDRAVRQMVERIEVWIQSTLIDYFGEDSEVAKAIIENDMDKVENLCEKEEGEFCQFVDDNHLDKSIHFFCISYVPLEETEGYNIEYLNEEGKIDVLSKLVLHFDNWI